jgi:hypothetical protein
LQGIVRYSFKLKRFRCHSVLIILKRTDNDRIKLKSRLMQNFTFTNTFKKFLQVGLSFKDLSIHRADSVLRLCFILCYDYNYIPKSTAFRSMSIILMLSFSRANHNSMSYTTILSSPPEDSMIFIFLGIPHTYIPLTLYSRWGSTSQIFLRDAYVLPKLFSYK